MMMDIEQAMQSMTISPTPEATDNRRSRYGRVIKPPVRYTPVETCIDDYAAEDYDSDESNTVSSIEYYESDDFSSESDADENGNLKDFVVKTSSDEEDNGVRSDSDDTDIPNRGRARRTKNASTTTTLVL